MHRMPSSPTRLPRRSAPPAEVPFAAALSLHAAVLGAVWTVWQPPAPNPTPPHPPLTARVLEATREHSFDTPQTPIAAPRERPARRRAETRPLPAPRRAARSDSEAPSAAPMPEHAFAPDEAAAAAPADAPQPLVSPETVENAARSAARGRTLARQSDELIGAAYAPSATETLGAKLASSAAGDCLKGGEGGYDKQGLGLLAVPFVIFDAATGECRK